jgi:hypothetical protein
MNHLNCKKETTVRATQVIHEQKINNLKCNPSIYLIVQGNTKQRIKLTKYIGIYLNYIELYTTGSSTLERVEIHLISIF